MSTIDDSYFDVRINDDDAKGLLKDINYKYSELTETDLLDIASLIQLELKEYNKQVHCPIITRCYLKKRTKREDKEDVAHLILIDGTYFHEREAITFYSDGQVCFCREMSGYNRIPIFNGFYKWIDRYQEVE